MLDLLPDSARIEGGELVLGGLGATALAEAHGTPLVVYCEETLRARARAYREAAPDAGVLYSVKAFPNVAVLSLFREEALGAEASTLGELVSRAQPGSLEMRSSSTATTRQTRSCAPARRRAASSCSTRPTTRSGQRPPACVACWFA